MASIVMLLLISVAPTLGLPAADPSAQVLAAITPLVQKIAAKYNCSVSVGIPWRPYRQSVCQFCNGHY